MHPIVPIIMTLGAIPFLVGTFYLAKLGLKQIKVIKEDSINFQYIIPNNDNYHIKLKVQNILIFLKKIYIFLLPKMVHNFLNLLNYHLLYQN